MYFFLCYYLDFLLAFVLRCCTENISRRFHMVLLCMMAVSKVMFAYTQIFMTLSFSSWAAIFYELLTSVRRYLWTKAKVINCILRHSYSCVWRQGFYRRKSIWISSNGNQLAVLELCYLTSVEDCFLLASSLWWVKFFCAVSPVAHQVAYTKADSAPVTMARLCL